MSRHHICAIISVSLSHVDTAELRLRLCPARCRLPLIARRNNRIVSIRMSFLDPDRFTAEVPGHFLCEICTGVVVNPAEHSTCETAFCGACIERWLETKPSCPHCREDTTSPASGLRPLHRVLRLQLEGLSLRCERHPDCNAVLSLGSVASHVETCRFIKRKCGVPGCGVEYVAADHAMHMEDHAGKHVELLMAALKKQERDATTSTNELFDCEAPVNTEGAPMKLGTNDEAKLYCGRRLGRGAIPGSDGRCGPNNGPQCQACSETKIFNARGHQVERGRASRELRSSGGVDKLYCGKRYDIPGTDGRCGPENGPQCKYCVFLQAALPRSVVSLRSLRSTRERRSFPDGLIESDIGTFAQHQQSPGRELLSSCAEEAPTVAASAEEVEELLSTMPAADPSADFTWMPGPVLLPEARAPLLELLDEAAAECSDPGELEDLKLTLREEELRTLIGDVPVEDLKALPGFPSDFTSIRLRRCEAAGHCINFHLDHSLRTMQVALNDDSEYTGGALVFANQAGLHRPARPAGSATIHAAGILHGVTELVQGDALWPVFPDGAGCRPLANDDDASRHQCISIFFPRRAMHRHAYHLAPPYIWTFHI